MNSNVRVLVKTFVVFLFSLAANLYSSSSVNAAEETNPTDFFIKITHSNSNFDEILDSFVEPTYSIGKLNSKETSDYSLINGESKLELIPSESGFKTKNALNISIPTRIESLNGTFSMPVGIILTGPISIGKITFPIGSSEISTSALNTLRSICDYVKNSGMLGIYIVGNADNTGSNDFNLWLSNQRSIKTAKILREQLNSSGVKNYSLIVENMSNYLAKGKFGMNNQADRSVTFLVYPKI